MKRSARAILSWMIVFAIVWGPVAQAAEPLCAEAFSTEREAPRTEESVPLEVRTEREITATYESLKSHPSWWKSHLVYRQHLQVIREFSQRIERMDEISHPELKDPRFNELLKTIILKPETPLTTQDLRLISSHKSYQDVVKGTLQLLSLGEMQLRSVQRLGQFWSARASHPEVIWAKGFKAKSIGVIRAIYNGPIRFFSPAPLPRSWTATDRIFEAQFKNPQRELSEAELRTLRETGAEKIYHEKQTFARDKMQWTRFRRWVRASASTAIGMNALLIVNLGLHLMDADSFVPVDQFIANENYRLLPNQVRVYNESVPFPHMAIEIDGRVYSYGQTHMTVSSAQDYLMSQDYQRIMRENMTAEGVMEKTNFLNTVFNATGLNQMPRSVQMVTLNLTPAEKDQLKRSLIMATGMRYRNHTLAMDCATMIVNALKDNSEVSVPTLIDASPSMVIIYLGFLKTLGIKNKDGLPLVTDIRQVGMGALDKPDLHLYRNLFINSLEGKLLWTFLPFSMTQRAYLHARYGQDNFQYWDPEVRAVIESWQKTVEEELAEDVSGDQLQRFREEAAALGSVSPSMRNREWQERHSFFDQIVNSYFQAEKQAAHAISQSPDTNFQDTVRAAYRYDLLEVIRLNLLAEAKGQSAGANGARPSPAGTIIDALKAGRSP
jgi:hypothetical protein